MTPELSPFEGNDPREVAVDLRVLPAIEQGLGFLVEWGFRYEHIEAWSANFSRGTIVVFIARDPFGYEIFGSISDSSDGNRWVDFQSASTVISGYRDPMIHAANREQVVEGVQLCAQVLRELGRPMLVDQVGLGEFFAKAHLLMQEMRDQGLV